MLPIGLFFNCACYLHQSAPNRFLKTIAEYIAFCNVICTCKILTKKCIFSYTFGFKRKA